MKQDFWLSNILISVLYLMAMSLVVLYVWNEQSSIRRGGDGPLYRNLMDCPAYVRRGFDRAYTLEIPAPGGEWARFQSAPLRIANSPLPNLPKLPFLWPWGKEPEEFTINMTIELDSAALEFLNSDLSVLPGMFFACIGENWEIFFNGKLVRSEMHLDEAGRIMERRTWRDVYFPLDKSLAVPGTNVLSLRIVGDPAYDGTGFYYAVPYYLDDYRVIEKRQRNILLPVLFSIAGFTGIYYLMIFLSVRRKREIYNLYYGIFAILFCVYSIVRTGLVNSLIPNSDISIRLEYASLFMLVPAFSFFFESIGRGKITKITWGYTAFSGFLSLSQTFFCAKYGDDVLKIWNLSAILYFSYVFFYSIIYSGIWVHIKNKKLDVTMSHILVGSTLIYACGLFDTLDIIFFHNSFNLFIYSTFVVYIGLAFTLAQRFSGMYMRLEQSNIILETQVHERTAELEEQTRIAVQASMAKSEFLATMSHEIRTPLNAVIGLAEIELQGFQAGFQAGSLPESTRDNIAKIHQSGTSLLGMINDILDISKIEAGRFEIFPAVYDTAQMLSNTLNLNKVRIGDKPLTLKLEINSDFPAKLIGDELRIRQILNNLLSNAIKYTKEGSVTFTAEWEKTAGANEAWLRFSVRDTGIGIRKEDIGKLFTDYTQLDTMSNRRIEGTGLGLEIARKLAEMMGGSIGVESEYGKGSVFTVELMQGIEGQTIGLSLGEETAEALRNFSYRSWGQTGSPSPGEEEHITRLYLPERKVLVVDDLQDNLHVARGLLAPYGLQIDTAVSGREAIEKAKANQYDLIFMDHMMPEMDGVETAAAIRKSGKQTPIIAITANALRGMKEWYLGKGFDGYLSKPISSEALDEVMRKYFQEIGSEVRQHSVMSTIISPIPTPYSLEIESRRLDKLKHFNAGFQTGLEIEAEYFRKFTSFIESLDTLPGNMQADKALLAEAGQNEDAETIRETLPAFCETLSAVHHERMGDAGTEEERELYFKRYHDSFMED